MADKLIFPIGFDLEKGVKDAGDDWDKKYADRLEKLIAKRPVNVKLKLDATKLDSLDAVKKRLAELKIEPVTPETKAAIKELAAELRTLAKALEQVQKYSTGRATASPDAVRAARINEINKRSEAKEAVEREKARVHAARAEQAELKLAQARAKAAMAATKGAEATRNLNREYKAQDGYISRLIKRLAVYAGFMQIKNFLTQVREVTAEFELQRVSLGAIIQDQARANQLFSEIKSFALKSPVSILDLTKYTKQLAAYKIGVDELFETTKKLTDVSVGLGVSMDRVVLAYGQTRATGYLRASEIRQFTEMGVPIVEELAAKLSKMNGELVTAAQVMDMVSKRAISFELVKEVFDDMTSAGGMFYNMQEKQGNTLYGMWAKLGDAASVMYEEIGNTDSVNSAMKTTIQMLTDLMRHWRFWGKLLMWGGGLYLASIGVMKAHRLALTLHTAAGLRNAAAMKANVAAAEQTVVATRTAGRWTQWSARLSLAHARAQYAAATATNVFTKTLHSLKAAFLSNPLGMVILAVTTLIALFADADDSAKQFNQTLSEIEEKYTLKSLNDADNFKRLADGALKAAEGSKEQREKLEELNRTYGEIVGSENLRIDKLKEMNGEYQSLIDTIDEYNIKMKYSEREAAIKEYYGGKKKDAYGDFVDELSTIGLGSEELGREAGAAIAINVQNALLEELEKDGRATVATAQKIIEEQARNVFKARGKYDITINDLVQSLNNRLLSETTTFVETLNAERAAINANREDAEKAGGKLAKVYGDIKRAKEELNEISYVDKEGVELDTNTFLYQQTVANETMKKAADLIRNSQEIKDALGDKAKKLEPMWLHLVDSVSEDDLMNITTINFDAILKIIDDKYPDLKRRIQAIQKEWGNIAPTNETALQIRQKLFELSNSFDPTLQNMKRFLWDGSGAVDDYLKRLKEQQEKLKARLKEKQATLIQASKLSFWWSKLMGKDISAEIKELQNEIAALDKLIPFVTAYTNPKEKGKKGGAKSDPRLQILNEMVQLAEKLNKEYTDWQKKVGDTKALEKVNGLYEETVKYAEETARKAGIKLPHLETPTNAKELNEYLEAVREVMETAKGLKGGKKAAIELAVKMSNNVSAEEQKALEDKIKALAEKISRTKTAKEFYDKILNTTGDYELAANVSMAIYGDTGAELQQQMAQQIRDMFAGYDVEVPVSVITDDNNVDYLALEKYVKEMQDKLGGIDSNTYKELLKIAQEGQKNLAKTYEGYLKDLEKAKIYSDKRIELARYTANKIAEIEASGYSESEKGRLKADYKEREDKEAAKLEYEAFKNSALYVQMFEDLDYASTSALTRMRDRLKELKSQWKNLDPTQLKELQSRLNEIDKQLAARNPFKALADAFKKYRDLTKSGRTKEGDELKADEAEKARKEAEAKMLADEKAYQAIVKQGGAETLVAKAYRAVADASKAAYNNAERTADETAEMANEWKNIADTINNANEKIDYYQSKINEALDGVRKIFEAFGASDDDLQFFDDVVGSLNEIVDAGQNATMAVTSFMSGDYFEAITSGISVIGGLISGVTNLFYAGRIKKANKEIKKQQELLDQLEYTYGRLEKIAERVFGADYISNYNQQLKILQAQATAYQKQYEAEKSKGKKADKEKLKEYQNSYRDTMDAIADMQGKVAEKMTGTDLASAARDFAKSWLDAYISFASTTDAMGEKFREMIQNMVVESLMAKVVEARLRPMFDKIDKLAKDGELSAKDIAAVMKGVPAAVKDIDESLKTTVAQLQTAGINVSSLGSGGSDLKGISREIAGASEESITGLAAMINTQNYYISHVPRISEDVAAIRVSLEQSGGIRSASVDTEAMWNRHIELQQGIYRHTEAIAERAERSAIAAEKIADSLAAVIKPRGASSSKVVMTN